MKSILHPRHRIISEKALSITQRRIIDQPKSGSLNSRAFDSDRVAMMSAFAGRKKWTLLLFLLALLVFGCKKNSAGSPNATEPPAGGKGTTKPKDTGDVPAFDPKPVVERLFKIIHDRDFPAMYTNYVRSLVDMNTLIETTPKFLLDNALAKSYAKYAEGFQWWTPLHLYASLSPKLDVIEVRDGIDSWSEGVDTTRHIPVHEVYVSLTFTSHTNAPFLSPLGRIHEMYGEVFNGQMLKKKIVLLRLSKVGSAISSVRIMDELTEYFTDLPFTIVAVKYDGHHGALFPYVVGGGQPYVAAAYIDGKYLEDVDIGAYDNGLRFTFGNTTLKKASLEGDLTGKTVTIKLTNKQGERDFVSFVIPKDEETFLADPPFFVRHPWIDSGRWTNTMLFNTRERLFPLETVTPPPK